LARRGHRITLFDKFADIKAVGAGILIQPSSMVVLQHLGLLDDLLGRGERIDTLIGLNHKKQQVFVTRYSDVDAHSFGLGIHRAFVFDALYQACQVPENITFVLNHEVHDLNDLQRQYDLVILANGSHSDLRQQLPIRQHHRLYPYGCVWTTVHDDSTTPHKLQQYVYRAQQMFGLLPTGTQDGQRLLSVFWSLPIRDKDTFSKEAMFAAMEQHHPDPVLMQKIRAADFAFAVYADVWMQQFHHQNLVVIGDAAHGMSPQLGQGANMALLDAYFLDRVLAKVDPAQSPGPLPEQIAAALARYSTLRRKHVDFYTQASKFLTPLFQSDRFTCGLVRDTAFAWAQRLPLTRAISGHILCGKRTSWWRRKELDYEV
jgi:2-polyprenyl-6-methoxyphenol hydroxylase-like FAD-dependent oxidoreductase